MAPLSENSLVTLSVSPVDAGAARLMPRQLRLRLMPARPEAPIMALVSDSPVVVGRSSTDADFVAQLRPRCNVNDARTRRIGRAQTHLQLRLDRLRIDEPDAMNPTLVLDTPMRQRAALSLPAQIVIAGEFPLKIRLVPSTFEGPRKIEGWSQPDALMMQGALVVKPGSSTSLPCQAALVVSDVTLSVDSQGRPKFRQDDEPGAALGRIHRFGGQFWWQDLLSDGNNGQLVLLKPNDVLRLGEVEYQVLAHELQVPSMAGDETTMA